MTLKQVIEALVFASPKPILTKEIVAALKSAAQKADDSDAQAYASVSEDEVHAVIAELQAEYAEAGRSFLLEEQVSGWAMVTSPSAARWVRQLYPEAKPTRLSGPALETLAIIAYRQPVTRADIEAVRGVAVDGVMQVLLERSLVKIAGRAEVPGRPLLYATTEYFLQHFGLKTVEELPNSQELRRVHLPTAPVAEASPAPTESTTKAVEAAEGAEPPPEPADESEAAPEPAEETEPPEHEEPAPEEPASEQPDPAPIDGE